MEGRWREDGRKMEGRWKEDGGKVERSGWEKDKWGVTRQHATLHSMIGKKMLPVVVVVVVFTLKAVPVSTRYFLTSVLVQLTRTPSVVTG